MEPPDAMSSPNTVRHPALTGLGWLAFFALAALSPVLAYYSYAADPWGWEYDPSGSWFAWSLLALPASSLYCGLWAGWHMGENRVQKLAFSALGTFCFVAMNLFLLLLVWMMIQEVHFTGTAPVGWEPPFPVLWRD